MEQVGIVKKIDGSKMQLEVKRVSGCGGGCSSCGANCAPGHMVTMANKLNAKVGDVVEIKGDTKSLLKYTAVVYIIPLIFFLLGTAVSISILKDIAGKNYEVISLLIGIVTMALSFIIVKIIDKKVEKGDGKALTATRIL